MKEIKQTLFSQQTENKQQSESQSFNVNREGKNNRKIKRKGKKIIHNCCVLIKRSDGSQEIVVKQFHDICKLKTKACINKKINEYQVQKDSAVASGMFSDFKKFSFEKKQVIETQPFENYALRGSTQCQFFDRASLQFQEVMTTQYCYPSYFFMPGPSYYFQIL